MLFVETEYVRVMLDLIAGAEKSIEACCYEWAWYPGQKPGTAQSINRELVNCPKRGVKVRVLLHNESIGRHLGKVNRKAAHELEVHGVEVRMGTTAKILHAKFWAIDEKIGVVCTHNMSTRATKGNAEVGVVFEGAEDVAKLRGYFQSLWESQAFAFKPRVELERWGAVKVGP